MKTKLRPDLINAIKLAFANWSDLNPEENQKTDPGVFTTYNNFVSTNSSNLQQLFDNEVQNFDETQNNAWIATKGKKQENVAMIFHGLLSEALNEVSDPNDKQALAQALQNAQDGSGKNVDLTDVQSVSYNKKEHKEAIANAFYDQLKNNNAFQDLILELTRKSIKQTIEENDYNNSQEFFNKIFGRISEASKKVIDGKVQHGLYSNEYIGHLIFLALESIAHNSVGLFLESADPELAKKYYQNLDEMQNPYAQQQMSPAASSFLTQPKPTKIAHE